MHCGLLSLPQETDQGDLSGSNSAHLRDTASDYNVVVDLVLRVCAH